MKTGRVGRYASRAVAIATALLVVSLGVPKHAAASALFKATTARTESVTSGKWAATLSTMSMTFSANTNQTSTVTNSGTIALLGIGYKVTVSNPASGAPTFTLFVCTVVWSSGTCSGGAGTQIGNTLPANSTTTVSSTIVPAVAGHVYLQVEPAGVTASTTVTLGTSITSATQLRAAVKTNQ